MQLNKEAMGPTGAMKDSVASRLGANWHIKGEITGSEDLVIEGSVEGLVQLDERKLTIGKTAKVTADIIVGEVLVYGIVTGNVRAKNRIEIKKDGSVDGNLNTAQITIEDGAFFKGSENTVEPSRPKSAEVEQPVPQPKDARVPSFWLADNKRATTPPLLSLPTSSTKSIKVPRRLLRIAIAAAAIASLFAAGRIAVQQHLQTLFAAGRIVVQQLSQKTLKDGKTSAAPNSPATSEPKQRNETSAEIRHRNLPTTWTQNIPQPPVTRDSPGQNANVRSPVPASEAVSNHQAVAPTPLAMTPTQILNYTEFSGRASHPPAESTRQAGPTPGVPTSSLEGKPVQTLESRPAQTGEGTTQSKDSNAASSPPNSSAVPAETSPTPIATDKETNAAPPKQPEASEPMPASGTVDPSASPASGTPIETKSKEPRGPERIQRGKLIMQVNPVYPKDAQRQGIEGPVKVHVVFSPEGTVTNVTFVSGPQALATAAMDAVRQWRYSPTLFDGKPVETEDEVTIRFRLAKSQRQGSKKDKDEDELM